MPKLPLRMLKTLMFIVPTLLLDYFMMVPPVYVPLFKSKTLPMHTRRGSRNATCRTAQFTQSLSE